MKIFHSTMIFVYHFAKLFSVGDFGRLLAWPRSGLKMSAREKANRIHAAYH